MMNNAYSLMGIPNFVKLYVGLRGIVLTRDGDTWTLTGHIRSVKVEAGTAQEARDALTRVVSKIRRDYDVLRDPNKTGE